MGLWLYMFNYPEWDKWYKYNCSMKTVEEWNAEGSPNISIGMLYILFGVSMELLYIPFLIVMIRPEFIQHSCYKFMFLLGIIDMIVLPFNAVASGIQCIFGYHYCSNPTLHFFLGVPPSSGWYGTGMTCLLLGIDRFFEMLAPRIAHILFSGRRIYIWLSIPLFYMFFTFFQEVATYNNRYFAMFFDPFYGEPGWLSAKHIDLTFHCVHNVAIVIGLGGIYSILCFVIAMKSRLFKNQNISKLQKLMTLQSMCICIEIFIAAIVYIIMQFVELPDFIIVIAHACWICVHGDTPIVYLILNPTLRKAMFKLVRDVCRKTVENTTFMTRQSSTQGAIRRAQGANQVEVISMNF